MSSTANVTLTAREALRLGSERLERAGIATARLDMSLLLAMALRTTRLQIYTDLDRPLTDSERIAARELLARRLNHEPMAYIFGEREFFGKSFKVTPAVLIPRPETEHLVEAAIAWASENYGENHPFTFADIGTGSGIIAICIAAAFPQARGIATDISPEALAVAQANAERHGVGDRIDFRLGSLLEPIGETIDLLCSNPPYISDADRASLARDVIGWEPHQALFSGEQGLEHLNALVSGAPRVVRPRGLVLLECGVQQAEAITSLATFLPYSNYEMVRDLAGIERVVRLTRAAD